MSWIAGFNLLLLAAAQDATLEKELREIIEGRNEQYVQALLNGDAESFAALFAENAVVMVPGAPDIVGRHNIFLERRSDFQRIRVAEASVESQTLDTSGDLLYETGRFRYKLEMADKPPRVVSGRFLVIWKRQQDGSWKIQVDAGFPD